MTLCSCCGCPQVAHKRLVSGSFSQGKSSCSGEDELAIVYLLPFDDVMDAVDIVRVKQLKSRTERLDR